MKSRLNRLKHGILAGILIAAGLFLEACATATAQDPSIAPPTSQPVPTATVPMPTTVPSTASTTGLENTRWQVTAFGPSSAPTPIVSGTNLSLNFEADGQVTGLGGCNSFGGQYKITADTIAFDELISTLRACVDTKVQQQEERYLAALNSTGKFKRDGNSLTIWYDNGNSILVLKATT